MNETAAETAYDPIPGLARLLCAAQRQGFNEGERALPGLTVALDRLCDGLHLPELTTLDEAEVAIREALKTTPEPQGDPLMATHQGAPVDARDNTTKLRGK